MFLESDLNGEFCMGCGTRLVWGKFAYKQEICWDCFEQKVISIAMLTRDAEDRDIVLYLLNAQKEIQKGWIIKDIKAVNARCHSCGAIVPGHGSHVCDICFERSLRNSRLDKDVLR